MVERKDREPGFDGIADLDETHDIPAGLRSEDRHADERSAKANRSGSLPDSAGTVGIPDAGAGGLHTRVPPAGLGLGDTAAGDPGRAIRRAREALGLDATTLAYRTRLSLRTIEDLESNRLDAMPPAYVRGYLRAIARELSSDSEGWIRAYEGLGYTEPVLRPTLQKKAPVRAGRRRLRRIGLVLLLLAGTGGGAFVYIEREHGESLAGFLAWTQDIQGRWSSVGAETDADATRTRLQDAISEDVEPRTTAVAEAMEPAEPLTELEWIPEPGLPALLDDAADTTTDETASLRMEPMPRSTGSTGDAVAPLRPEDLRAPDRDAQETAADAAPATALPVAPSESETPLSSDEPRPSGPALSSQDPLLSSQDPTLSSQDPWPDASGLDPDRFAASDEPGPNAMESTAGDPTAPGASETPSAEPPAVSLPMTDASATADAARPGALRLEFQQTSWIEIRSASDRVVLQGIFHPGDDRVLSVQLPARVMLGNAPGVTLYHQGIPVALEPYTRDNRTARFNLEAP